MKRLLLLTAIFLTACGPSSDEKKNIAAVTCSIMGETRNMDAAVRVEKMNDAREKIGEEPFLGGDSKIKESFEYGLCQELVLNENYYEKLSPFLEAEREREQATAELARIEREKQAELARIEREKQAELARIKREQQADLARIAEERRVKDKDLYKKLKAEGKQVSVDTNGNIEMARTMKNNLLHGELTRFYKNGQPMLKVVYEKGKKEGVQKNYDSSGNVISERCFIDGSESTLNECS